MNRITKKKMKQGIELKNKLEVLVPWLEKGVHSNYGYGHRGTNALRLADGTTLSIQASETHYCEPRKLVPYAEYSEFEIGYPSKNFGLLKQYAEDPENMTDTVYGWVPIKVIKYLIRNCGGVVGYKNDPVYKVMKLRRKGKLSFQRVIIK